MMKTKNKYMTAMFAAFQKIPKPPNDFLRLSNSYRFLCVVMRRLHDPTVEPIVASTVGSYIRHSIIVSTG